MENTELLQAIKLMFDESNKRFDRMEADLAEVKDRTKKMELTLENDIAKKLSALYDGHMLNTEKLEHISDTVDDIESSVVALDVMNKVNTDEIIKLKFIK